MAENEPRLVTQASDPELHSELVIAYMQQGSPRYPRVDGIAWEVVEDNGAIRFVEILRDDPTYHQPRTKGRWHDIYGYTPKEK